MLEDELRALVSQSPAPEFEARVRMRIAAQPAHHAWLAPWRLTFAGVAAAAFALIAYLSFQPPASVAPAAPKTLDSRAAVTYSPLPDAVRPLPVMVPHVDLRHPVSFGRDVIVNRAETLALQRLFASPPLVVTREAVPGGAQTAAGVPEPIEIPELTIAPLAIEEVKGEPHDR